MKNYLLCFFTLVICASQHVFSQYVPNGTLEEWDTVSLGWSPDEYMSMNMYANGASVVFRDTNAVSGNYAVYMQSIELDGDTLFGAIWNGDPEDGEGGSPFSQTPDSITGYFKYNIAPNDTGLIIVMFKSGGQVISASTFYLTGSHSSYTKFSYPLSIPALLTPDTVIFAAACSNAMVEYADPASYLYLDKIEFTGTGITQTIPNNDFENWTEIIYEDPAEWATYNQYLIDAGDIHVEKDTNAYEGMYAAKITTLYKEDWGDTISWVVVGGHWTDSNSTGFAVPETQFKSLSGYYQFVPVDSADTAIIYAVLFNDGNYVDYQQTYLGATSGSYTRFELPFTYSGVSDSAQISIFTGNTVGSILYIDSLDLREADTAIFPFVANIPKIENLFVYPSPANQFIWVKIPSNFTSSIVFELFDLSGNKIKEWNVSGDASLFHSKQLNIADLSEGTYLLKASSNNYNASKTIIKINH